MHVILCPIHLRFFLRDYASFCVLKKGEISDAMQLLVEELYCINLCYV